MAAQTLTGATVGSPSPAPDSAAPSRASTTEPGALDDAPSDSERGATPVVASAGASKTAAAKAPVKRVASVGLASSRAGSVGLNRTPSIGGSGAGAARDRPVGGLLGSTSEFRAGAGGAAAGKAKFRPNMRRVQSKAVESDDDECVSPSSYNSSSHEREK